MAMVYVKASAEFAWVK